MTTNHTTVDEVRTGSLGTATPVFQQTRPVEYHAIGSLTIAAGGAGANYACPGTGTKYDIKGLKLQLSFAAVGNNMVGGDALTVYFYQLREGTYYLLDTKAVTTLATTAGSVTKVEVPCDFADTTELHGATHFAVAGNVAVAAGGATGSTVYVDYDLFADEDVALEFSGTIGAVTVAAIGASTDAPVTSLETVEDATARTGISLWKRIINMTIGWWAAYIQRYRVSGADTYWAAGTRVDATSFTFTPDTRVTAVTDDKIVQIVQRSSAGAWVSTPLGTVHITGAGAPYTCTVSGASFTAGDLIQICMRGTPRSHIDATNHDRTGEISPIDTRAVQVTAIASNVTVTKNTVVWYPGAVVAAAPTSCWDTFSLNANGGKAKQVSFTGSITTTSTGYFKVWATDDPNATVASKRWVQVAMYDCRAAVKAVVENVTVTNSTVAFVVNLDEFTPRYLCVTFSETANSADLTAVYLDASFGW